MMTLDFHGTEIYQPMFGAPRDEPQFANTPFPRLCYAASVTGSTNAELHKRLMREWYGLTPARASAYWLWSACPHRLVGKRCTSRDAELCELSMPFREVQGGYLWDHDRAWRNSRGELVYTLEPYGNPFHHADEFREMEAALRSIGVAASVEGRSPYGASYIIFLTDARTAVGKNMQRHADRAAKRHATTGDCMQRPNP